MSQQQFQPRSQYQAQPQSQYQAQQPAGSAMASQFPMASAAAARYEQMASPDVQNAVAALDQLANVAEWTKTQVARRGNPRVVRICEDIQDLAHLEKKLILRESPFAAPVGESIRATIQSGVQELRQHAAEPEVQDAINRAQQTLNALQNTAALAPQPAAQSPAAQSPAAQQPAAQQPATQQPFANPAAQSPAAQQPAAQQPAAQSPAAQQPATQQPFANPAAQSPAAQQTSGTTQVPPQSTGSQPAGSPQTQQF